MDHVSCSADLERSNGERHLQATAAMFNLDTDLDRWEMSPRPFLNGTPEGRRLKKRLVQLPTVLAFG